MRTSSGMSRSKRSNVDAENDTDKKKQKMSKSKALAEEYEQELKEKHGDKYTHFQYKLWAEILASGVHPDSDDLLLLPCMVSCTTKRHKQLDTRDAVVNGMMSVVNTLCQAVTDKQSNKPPTSSCASPMKKAELHSMYIHETTR